MQVAIDLKSETLPLGDLSPWIQFQLTIYGHLIEQAHGVLPTEVSVFSLNRGIVPLAVSSASVDAALQAVELARSTDQTAATPEIDTCRFCRRRFDCAAHWTATATWETPDCVEGDVEQVDHADNGVVAYRLAARSGPTWVSNVPSIAPRASVGDHVRFVRIQIRRADYDGPVNWRWGARSALLVGSAPN